MLRRDSESIAHKFWTRTKACLFFVFVLFCLFLVCFYSYWLIFSFYFFIYFFFFFFLFFLTDGMSHLQNKEGMPLHKFMRKRFTEVIFQLLSLNAHFGHLVYILMTEKVSRSMNTSISVRNREKEKYWIINVWLIDFNGITTRLGFYA